MGFEPLRLIDCLKCHGNPRLTEGWTVPFSCSSNSRLEATHLLPFGFGPTARVHHKLHGLRRGWPVATCAHVRTLKSQSVSIAFHLLVLGFGFLIGSRTIVIPAFQPPPKRPTALYFSPLRKALVAKSQTSGGANAGALPARRGAPPPRAARTFIPPAADRQPKLPLPVSIAFNVPELVRSNDFGDPLSGVNTNSLGLGGRNGIGDHGCCGGIGDHDGPPGLDVHAVTADMTPPKLIYKIEPEFSEEARKAKFQGTVILAIEVDQSGRTRNFRIISSPGLGLDQKAIEAVLQWRFRPAYLSGKPVASSARVEVSFHLL